MVPLLYLVLSAEVAVALLLLVKLGPIRGLDMKGLDEIDLERSSYFEDCGLHHTGLTSV